MDILKEKGLISVLIPEPEKIAMELKYVAFYKIDILYLNEAITQSAPISCASMVYEKSRHIHWYAYTFRPAQAGLHQNLGTFLRKKSLNLGYTLKVIGR